MKSRLSENDYFMGLAHFVSKRSTCPRRSVGCVIVDKNGHIKATGYNGVPKNYTHCIEHPCGGEMASSGSSLDKCLAIHAEQNALLQCSKIMEITSIYITDSPCITCAKLIANTSCQIVYYAKTYAENKGLTMLNTLGILTKHHGH